MRAETRQALIDYKEKFGKDFPENLDKLRNSEEAGLIFRIREAIKAEPTVQKLPKRTDIQTEIELGDE